ncbi:hypothetical protein TWF481_010941 [Arthrobotrys musiformis]|uniref:Uncharacterized protein n=1 Tax=Arthrobotrys musiformis TaxID=47236 RepID=A0AAV9VZC2_9PEZI
MHLTTSFSAAVAFLGCASSVYGHGLIVDAYGNSNERARGRGLGFIDQYAGNRKGTGQHPFQVDVPVFKDPIVPCCHRPRTYLNTGCGLTLHQVWRKNIQPNKALLAQWWYAPAVQNLFMTKRGYQIDTAGEMNLLMSKKLIPQASAGGWLKMRIHQVNADGAGPYKCRLDSTGMATAFGPWLNPTQNIPGDKYSVNLGTVHKPNLWIHLPIPVGTRCTGTYGSYTRVCMVRCENQAVNGPFGGCVPFQQVGDLPVAPPVAPIGKPQTHPPKPTITAQPPTIVTVTQPRETVTITTGRPPTKQELEIALGGETYPEEVIDYIQEKGKIPNDKGKELVNEAKDANEEAEEKAENEPMDEYF